MSTEATVGREARDETEAPGKKPTLIAYSVKDQAIWTRIGAAWAHKRGPGFSIQLEALPLDGRIVLVAPSADRKAAANEA